MALSPNYSWAEPDNSSLVKNGAQDIRALGDAIDTSLWNVGFGQAGKNKIINGDFGIWQRGTSFTNPANSSYTADRFTQYRDGTGTVVISQQAFTPGAAPVAGYENPFFYRFNQTVAGTGGTYSVIEQRIEDVRTFAGQTATFSFWAKADSARSITPQLIQSFGTGGSGAVFTSNSAITLTTSWARYTTTFAVPSVSGKTIGAGSYLSVNWNPPQNTTQTLDTWGWQLEYGSKATPFETASGSIQGELALCQRYYWKVIAGNNYGIFGLANGGSTTQAYGYLVPDVTMRAMNTLTSGNIAIIDGAGTSVVPVTLSLQASYISTNILGVVGVGTAVVPNRSYLIQGNNNGAAFVAIDGEL